MRNLFIFIALLTLWSCDVEVQLQEMTETEVAKTEELATIIQAGFEYNQPQNIVRLFDSKKFSKRLGRRMITKKGHSPQFILDVIDDTFVSMMNDFTKVVYYQDFHLGLVDYHKKDNVIRIIYSLIDPSDLDSVYNFFVFYVAPDADGNLEIVNIYNVFSGYSLGQSMRQFANNDFNTMFYKKGFDKAIGTFEKVQQLVFTEKFQEAYDLITTIEPKFQSFSFIAAVKLRIASQLDSSIYIKELKRMKTMTPNEQSKTYYDCVILSLELDKEGSSECVFELEQLLSRT